MKKSVQAEGFPKCFILLGKLFSCVLFFMADVNQRAFTIAVREHFAFGACWFCVDVGAHLCKEQRFHFLDPCCSRFGLHNRS